MNSFKNTLIQITQNGMGSGNEELGQLLAKNYLTLLCEETEVPQVITFYNEGVKLICSGSEALEPLKLLAEKGVKLVACKTCLNHFQLLEKVEVGITATMVDIMHFQKVAEKVVNL
ncbi:DsrE/DsrF-like family protein [Draconibacterium orientale]|jgi:intracellular sulfur oxidation DsrE/DsrF family protein|uniref:DsrE/DsrF-like family protein n=1 Tax=Draconibacterium orientale TaxID=1168034 RepID=X5DTL2_9BACT|nr:DsrE family protein [Draconibacterium orientale]AHW58510.1 response regulator SirA [Draconibacterium orientale]SET88108.1 DsrE/DsrF-like family protein [Draconibacterium orientale]